MPIRCGEYTTINAGCVGRFGLSGRGVRRNTCRTCFLEDVICKEHQRERRSRNGDRACIGGLVAINGNDVKIAFESTINCILCSQRLNKETRHISQTRFIPIQKVEPDLTGPCNIILGGHGLGK